MSIALIAPEEGNVTVCVSPSGVTVTSDRRALAESLHQIAEVRVRAGERDQLRREAEDLADEVALWSRHLRETGGGCEQRKR